MPENLFDRVCRVLYPNAELGDRLPVCGELLTDALDRIEDLELKRNLLAQDVLNHTAAGDMMAARIEELEDRNRNQAEDLDAAAGEREAAEADLRELEVTRDALELVGILARVRQAAGLELGDGVDLVEGVELLRSELAVATSRANNAETDIRRQNNLIIEQTVELAHHRTRVRELQEANNAELERRRQAENDAKLASIRANDAVGELVELRIRLERMREERNLARGAGRLRIRLDEPETEAAHG